MNPVVHFEMPYDDADRLSSFYEKAFGWKMNKTGEQMGNYVLAQTTETDENNMVQKPGTINGGFFPKTIGMPVLPSVVIQVPDLKASIDKVTASGGKIHGEPMDIPGIGNYVAFMDTEGNHVGMLQPMKM